MEKVFEIRSIKQVRTKVSAPFTQVKSPYHAVDIIHHFIGDEAREIALVLILDTKLNVLAVYKVTIGNIGSTILEPREIFQATMLANGRSVIIAHNHPSGSVEPSPEDIKATERIAQAGNILGIDVLDHVIVAVDDENNKKHLSLREAGYINFQR
ncbi:MULTISPECIES: JAB domain-containing protein [Bacillus]|uniref:JAB domain-containing protein n=1 Tax=Bacillus TaxID=1386 RepID=UPI0010AE6BC3|nr:MULTISPECIES: JAB domain-containing protein [Bacillus]TKD54553.1 DNA repair protein RadC [Bacillus sp. S2(2019)]